MIAAKKLLINSVESAVQSWIIMVLSTKLGGTLPGVDHRRLMKDRCIVTYSSHTRSTRTPYICIMYAAALL